MRYFNSLLLLSVLLFCTQNSFSQLGKDGDYTASTADNVLNSYTFLTVNGITGQTSITVDDNAMIGGVFASALTAGDLIMIIQMQGANIDCNTLPTAGWGGTYTAPDGHLGDWTLHKEKWGAITAYNGAGNYEKVEVTGVSGGNVIQLQCGLKHDYIEARKVQIVRIPRFNNLTVNGGLNSIIPTLWDGQTGGIVALEVNSTLDIAANSSISASGYGFRGGELDPDGTSGNTNDLNAVTFLGSYVAAEGSEKGESIMGYHVELDALFSRYGISAPANGGGGGGYSNTGGGGGANIGSGTYTGNGVPIGVPAIWDLEFAGFGGSTSPGGGRGGYSIAGSDQDETTLGPRQLAWSGDGRKTNGGLGGHPLTYDPNKTFFGGGGGAGEQDDGEGGAGGRGGGIVYITSYGNVIGDGTIEVNGEAGQNSNWQNLATSSGTTRRGNDGAGGGGAGGSVIIENVNSIPSTISLDAIGGDGGNQVLSYFSAFLSREAGGPGASGSGGSISYSVGSPIENVSGGAPGETNSPYMTNFRANGATSGSDGVAGIILPLMNFTVADAAVCSGETVDLTAIVIGTLPSGSSIEWYDQATGGTLLNTGLTYTTASLTATTVFYVTICPDNYRIPVTVTVTPGNDPSFLSSDFCASTVNTISAVITPGGVFSISNQTGSGLATINSATGELSNFVLSDQITIQYLTPAGSCQDSSTQVVNVTTLDDASFTTVDFCESSVNVISAVAIPGGTYAISVQTGTATIDPNTGILSGYAAGDQITIEYTTPAGGCQNTSTQVVNVTTLDDASFTTVDFCESSVNVISAVAIPGGTYAITAQTGTATIDPNTGILSGYAAGDQITIEHTTPAGGCQNTSTQVVNVAGAPVLNVIDPTAVCEPNGVDLTDANITLGSDAGTLTYWTDSNASNILANANNITNGTVYYIQLENADGCQSISPVNVSFNLAPSLNSFIGGGNYCQGEIVSDLSANVSGFADFTLQYTLDGIAQSVTSTTTDIILGNTVGVYVLTNLSDANCTISLNNTESIVINSAPNSPSVSPDMTYCEGENINDITATGSGGTFIWYSDAALFDSIGIGSSFSPSNNLGQSIYYVIESNNGCDGAESSVSITIENCDIIVPTAFTPDGDLVNDTWEIVDIDVSYPNNIVYVYNRWGTNIFTSTQGEYDLNRWDGTYEGNTLPVGSYYYIIDYNKDGKDNANGIVTIILNK